MGNIGDPFGLGICLMTVNLMIVPQKKPATKKPPEPLKARGVRV